MFALPSEFSAYQQVLTRLADDIRPSGRGLSLRCPLADRHRNGDRKPSTRAWIGNRGELVVRCLACGAGWGEFVRLAGLPAAAWWPHQERVWMDTRGQHQPIPREVARYAYRDCEGVLIGWKLRLEPGYHGERKTFVWERPLPEQHASKLSPGAATVVRGLKEGIYTPNRAAVGKPIVYSVQAETNEASIELPGVDHLLGLYRQDELQRVRPEIPLFVVEGEKVADELIRIGLKATTGYAGFGKWDFHWGRDFASRRLVVVPDRDPRDKALGYAYSIAGSALYYRAAEIRMLLVPQTELPPDGGDICHWLERKGIALQDVAGRKEAVIGLVKRSDFYMRQN
jgi:hypothetical protein